MKQMLHKPKLLWAVRLRMRYEGIAQWGRSVYPYGCAQLKFVNTKGLKMRVLLTGQEHLEFRNLTKHLDLGYENILIRYSCSESPNGSRFYVSEILGAVP